MEQGNTAAGGPTPPTVACQRMKFCVLAQTDMGVAIEEFDTEQERLAWLSLRSDVVDDFYFLDIEGTIKDYGTAQVGEAAAAELEDLSR